MPIPILATSVLILIFISIVVMAGLIAGEVEDKRQKKECVLFLIVSSLITAWFIASNMIPQRWGETQSFKIINNMGIQWAINGDVSLNFTQTFGKYTENDYVMLQRRDNSGLYLGVRYPDNEVYRLVAR